MATTEPAAASAEEVVARERRTSPRAGIAALVAGVCVLVGNILLQAIYSDIPRVPLVDAVRDAAGQDIGRPGLLTQKILFYDDKAIPLLLTSIVQAIGVLCAAYALLHLHTATRDRHGSVPRIARLVVMLGGVATAVGFVGLQIIAAILSADFASGADKSTAAAHDALRSGVLVAAQFVGTIGTLALTFSFVIVSLGAMRVGLLTRFMGILGVITGLLQIFPLGPSAFVVQAFWLVALGAILTGLWRRGVPPAWQSGRAMPWPSQQQVREERQRRAKGEIAGTSVEEAPHPARPVPGSSSGSAAKRKRKRRA